MKRPRIDIIPNLIDKIITNIGVIGVTLLISIPTYYYSSLPEVIPTHFNINGDPNGFGGKVTIWILPIIGVLQFIILSAIKRRPHSLNYPIKITADNAQKQYTLGIKIINILSTLLVCSLVFLIYMVIQTALGNYNGIGKFALPVIMIIIFGPIGYYLYQSRKN